MVYTSKTYRKSAVINMQQVNVLFLILIGVLGLVYLFQINFMVSGGYKIRNLEQTIENVKKQTKQAEVEALELQSMQTINERSQELGFVPLKRATYVSPNSPVVALR